MAQTSYLKEILVEKLSIEKVVFKVFIKILVKHGFQTEKIGDISGTPWFDLILIILWERQCLWINQVFTPSGISTAIVYLKSLDAMFKSCCSVK